MGFLKAMGIGIFIGGLVSLIIIGLIERTNLTTNTILVIGIYMITGAILSLIREG